MRGVGGPLLCVGDLLSDVGEEDNVGADRVKIETVSESDDVRGSDAVAADLPRLFQDHYNHLNKALGGSDHSWTDLTLKLCSALETANKVVKCAHKEVTSISAKVEELETVVKRADSAVAVARAVNTALNQKNHL
uniref:Uncharacterized protein n=1 Tax=Kalanchoe fedtschenkoi TaxID=63787 RepID=A0A7N0UNZ2_KALFE